VRESIELTQIRAQRKRRGDGESAKDERAKQAARQAGNGKNMVIEKVYNKYGDG
jgi:hypothetical protein